MLPVPPRPLGIRIVQVAWMVTVAPSLVWYLWLLPRGNAEVLIPALMLLMLAGFPATLGAMSLLVGLSRFGWMTVSPVDVLFPVALLIGSGYVQWFVIVPWMWRRWSHFTEQFEKPRHT